MRRAFRVAMLRVFIAGVAALCTIPPAQAQPAATEERLYAIRARGELRVCTWPGYHGLSWRNPRTGEMEGLDVEMARLLANRLRVRLAFIEVLSTAIPAALEAGRCDVAMSGVTVSEERATRIAFSKPYLSTPLVGIASRASTRVRAWAEIDRPGVVVMVAEGAPAQDIMRETLRRAELAVLPPQRRRDAEVQAGRADVFITDMPFGTGLAMEQGWVRLVPAPPRFGETLSAYAVPRGDHAWLAEVNSFLAAVKSEGLLARAAERFGLAGLLVY